jgi:hypothetical protein
LARVQCDDLGRFQSQPRVFCFVAQDLADELGGFQGEFPVFAQGAVDIARAARCKEEVEAWEAERNRKHAKADWQFTTADARVKLKRL